jgi:hypothetical protein
MRDDSAGALELILAGEASAPSGIVGPDRFSSAIAELLGEAVATSPYGADRLHKRDPLRGGEILADLVFGVLARDDARDVDDPGQDDCPAKLVPLTRRILPSVKRAWCGRSPETGTHQTIPSAAL